MCLCLGLFALRVYRLYRIFISALVEDSFYAFLCSLYTQCTKIARKTIQCLSNPLKLLPSIRRLQLRNKSSNLHEFCYWESLHWRLCGELNCGPGQSNITPTVRKAKIEASRFFLKEKNKRLTA